MKQRLTKKPDFQQECSDTQYKLLHETELRVQRMERIIEDLLVWKEDTWYYKETVDEYKEYCDE